MRYTIAEFVNEVVVNSRTYPYDGYGWFEGYKDNSFESDDLGNVNLPEIPEGATHIIWGNR
jgi:hypothetical protein